VTGVLRGTGGGSGWPGKWSETIGKVARKFAATGGALCRLIVGGFWASF